MKNGKLGFGGHRPHYIVFLLGKLQIWTFINFLGTWHHHFKCNFYFIVNRKKAGIGIYWPITGIICGPILSFCLFATHHFLHTFGMISVFLFLNDLFFVAIKRKAIRKRFAFNSVGLLIVIFIFLNILPNNKPKNMPGVAYYDSTKDHIVWFCT